MKSLKTWKLKNFEASKEFKNLKNFENLEILKNLQSLEAWILEKVESLKVWKS